MLETRELAAADVIFDALRTKEASTAFAVANVVWGATVLASDIVTTEAASSKSVVDVPEVVEVECGGEIGHPARGRDPSLATAVRASDGMWLVSR